MLFFDCRMAKSDVDLRGGLSLRYFVGVMLPAFFCATEFLERGCEYRVA